MLLNTKKRWHYLILCTKNTKINITLGEEVTKEINNVMIETTNLDSNYRAAAIGGASSIKTSVVIKGTQEVLNAIDESKIKAIERRRSRSSY
mgnify:CR=1 FL=1